MALDKNFSNTVPDKKENERKIVKLTELNESNANTIFNLIFAEKMDGNMKE